METNVDMKIFRLQAVISKTMANPLRLAILYYLKGKEKTVNELVELVGASQSSVSQHLAMMRQRDMVKTRNKGTSIFYRVSNPKINQACDLVREVLLEQLQEKQKLIKEMS